MALLARATEPAPTQSSKLFASLFEGFDPVQRLRVLDVGLGLPESLDFFSAYRCRLSFLDLYSDTVVATQRDANKEELREQFEVLLQFPEGTQFDLCLFWDFLNYLDKPALQAFSRALQPYLHGTSRAHAIGLLNDQTALPHCEYSIVSQEQFRLRSRAGEQAPWFPHPQAELGTKLVGLDIHKALLLADGRLEILLGVST